MASKVSITTLLERFESEQSLSSLDDEQNRRIDFLHELINSLLESTSSTITNDNHDDMHNTKLSHHHERSNENLQMENDSQHQYYESNIKGLYNILCTGDRKSLMKTYTNPYWMELENGMILFHQLLFITTNTNIQTNDVFIPSHLLFFEMTNVIARNYETYQTLEGWSHVILTLILYSYGFEYIQNEIRNKYSLSNPIRWNRMNYLMLDSIRTISTMIHSYMKGIHKDESTNEIDVEETTETTILHPLILVVLKQYLLPTYKDVISLFPDPTDIIINGIGFISSLLPICPQNETTFTSDDELCIYIIQISNSFIDLKHILSHPLRCNAFATHHKQKQNKKQKQSSHSDSSDNEDDKDIIYSYSKDEKINKLALVTNSECSTLLSWNNYGIAQFANTLLQYKYESQTQQLSSIHLTLPMVYSPIYIYQLFFPHFCPLFLHSSSLSPITALTFLDMLLKHTTPTKMSYFSLKLMIQTCQLLLNTKKEYGIQLLQRLLIQYTSNTKAIDCVANLVQHCPYPNAIPILLDILRVYIDHNDKTFLQTNKKQIIQIIQPYTSNLENDDKNDLLQCYEVYTCVLNLLRRILLNKRLSMVRTSNAITITINNEERDSILQVWSMKDVLISRLETESKKNEEESFRLFLLQDALSQFINEAELYFAVDKD